MTPLFSPTLLAVVLFVLGLAGLLARRNIIFMLMSLEIMMNAGGVALIGGGAKWGQADGQVIFFLVLAMAAAEVAVGLALLLQIYRRLHTIDADSINEMRG